MRARVSLAFVGVAVSLHAAGAQTPARQLRLTEVLRIDGQKEDISGPLANMWVGRDGRVAVFDSPTAQFVFFDSTGKRLGTFGGRGQGPGEFEPNAGSMYLLQRGALGDTMWVYASNGRRYTLITPDLKLGRAFSLPQYDPSAIISFGPLALLANDRVLGRATFGARVSTTLPDGRVTTTLMPSDTAFVVMARDGTVQRRIADAPYNDAMLALARPGGQRTVVPLPFMVPPLIASSATGDRFAIVTFTTTSRTGGHFQVTVIRATADTVFSRTLPFTGAPIAKAMADSALAARERSYGSGSELYRAIREQMPTVLPPFDGVTVAFDGTVWLHRFAASSEPGQFVVLSASGELIGEARFPRARMALHAATRSIAWATETDDDGFLTIIRFRVDTQ